MMSVIKNLVRRHTVERGLLCLSAKGDHDESSDTRRNRFSRGVVVRVWGGSHVTNESARQRAECGAGPWGLGGRVRMGRRLQGVEEERLRRDDRSGGDHVAR